MQESLERNCAGSLLLISARFKRRTGSAISAPEKSKAACQNEQRGASLESAVSLQIR